MVDPHRCPCVLKQAPVAPCTDATCWHFRNHKGLHCIHCGQGRDEMENVTDTATDPRATLELIAELERVAIMHTPPAQATRMWEMREAIIRDLRRLADLEGKAQIGTHAADGSCWDWGRNHYECALRRLVEVEAENARLKRGEFTPKEFQGLCHHRDERPGCKPAEFFQGCEDYQRKLFGYAEADEMRKAINLLTREPSTAGYEVAAEWRDKCKALEQENARLKTLMDKIFDQHPEARTLYSCA